VQEQVEEMVADNISEESYSSYVNPLTLVQREGKRVTICLNAREVNKFMTPDRAKVPPMQMLLQRFCGANYISTLDLSSAFYKYHWKIPQGNGQLFSSRTLYTTYTRTI
jgi:hypothetical protein